MVPSSYLSYFTATAGVSGALIGLLFVAVSLRADTVFGPDAPPRGRMLAMSSFTALVNAFFVSVLAIVPQTNIGYGAIALSVGSLWNTVRLHRSLRRQEPQYLTLVLSFSAYTVELIVGVVLLVHPKATWAVNILCYVVFANFVAALSRAWVLVQGLHIRTAPPSAGRE